MDHITYAQAEVILPLSEYLVWINDIFEKCLILE